MAMIVTTTDKCERNARHGWASQLSEYSLVWGCNMALPRRAGELGWDGCGADLRLPRGGDADQRPQQLVVDDREEHGRAGEGEEHTGERAAHRRLEVGGALPARPSSAHPQLGCGRDQ